MNLALLAEPFPPSDIEWRIQSSGKKGDRVWARVLAYITNRAIMQRLDDVCGAGSWRNEYRHEPNGAVLCGLSILVNHPDGSYEWVTKWDGAEQTDIEAVKGGLSGAMKRAGVQWGIGRYLYDLEEGFAKVHDGGKHYATTKDKVPFNWDPPTLPPWALPSGAKNGAGVKSATETGGEQARVDPPKQEARQQAAPASRPAVEKVSEGMKLNGIRMATMSSEELEKLIAEKGGDLKYAKHITEAKRILASRTMESKFAAEVADQEASFQFK